MKLTVPLLCLTAGLLTTMAVETDLLDLVAAPGSFKINGAASEYHGRAVSSAGDVNNDGHDDIIVSSWKGSPLSRSAAGIVYVMFGGTSSVNDISLSTFTSGVHGFRIFGATKGDHLGFAVGSAGDVNGDGVNDIVVAATGADPEDRSAAGITYVIFGQHHANSTFSDIDLSTFSTGTHGVRIFGATPDSKLGWSVGHTGDVNGDGIDDIIIGAPGKDRIGAGAGYVLFGRAVFRSDIDLLGFTSGADGFRMHGVADSRFGFAVSGAGDVNGDGIADIIFGAHSESPLSRASAGAAYVIYGKATAYSDLSAATFTTGADGYKIIGRTAGSHCGYSVGRAGNFNADGFDDVIVGEPSQDAPGAATIIFGKAAASTESIDLSSIVPGNLGVRISGAASGDLFGSAVSGAGDVNGDGVEDVIIGAPLASAPLRSQTGKTYILFGQNHTTTATATVTNLDIQSVTTGTAGIVIQGAGPGHMSGHSVSRAGDVNGDGYSDVLIGSLAAGASYLISGGPLARFPAAPVPVSSMLRVAHRLNVSSGAHDAPSGIDEGTGAPTYRTAALMALLACTVIALNGLFFVCCEKNRYDLRPINCA